MGQITVDGCDYIVNTDSSHKFGFHHDYLSVIGADGLVGCAQIDHNAEHITVSYLLSDGTESEATYNYYEYLDSPAADFTLASWMVSTHPES